MKKLFGLIAIIAIIGFTMAGCSSNGNGADHCGCPVPECSRYGGCGSFFGCNDSQQCICGA